MLEQDGILRTWHLTTEPQPGQSYQGRRIADHRLIYLDYEGPVSGDRGEVHRWDFGTYQILDEQSGRQQIQLQGQRLQGLLNLHCVSAELWDFHFL